MPPPMLAAMVISPSDTAESTNVRMVMPGGMRRVRRHRHSPNHADAPASSSTTNASNAEFSCASIAAFETPGSFSIAPSAARPVVDTGSVITAMANKTPSAVGRIVSCFIASLSLRIETIRSANATVRTTVGKWLSNKCRCERFPGVMSSDIGLHVPQQTPGEDGPRPEGGRHRRKLPCTTRDDGRLQRVPLHCALQSLDQRQVDQDEQHL